MGKRKKNSGMVTDVFTTVVTSPAPKPIRDSPEMEWVYEMLGWKHGPKKSTR